MDLKPLPDVEPIPEPFSSPPVSGPMVMTTEDFRSLVTGLRPGRYTTAQLYPRYQVWAENERRATIGRHAFGIYLRRFVGPENVERGSGNSGRIYRLKPEHVGHSQAEEKPSAIIQALKDLSVPADCPLPEAVHALRASGRVVTRTALVAEAQRIRRGEKINRTVGWNALEGR